MFARSHADCLWRSHSSTSWRCRSDQPADISGNDRVRARHRSGIGNPKSNLSTGNRSIWHVLVNTLVSVNERDKLGGDLRPDYRTAVRGRPFNGFPFSYYGRHVDDPCKATEPGHGHESDFPGLRLGGGCTRRPWVCAGPGMRSFTAPAWNVVGQHGSWNHKAKSGQRVVFVRSIRGRPPSFRSRC